MSGVRRGEGRNDLRWEIGSEVKKCSVVGIDRGPSLLFSDAGGPQAEALSPALQLVTPT